MRLYPCLPDDITAVIAQQVVYFANRAGSGIFDRHQAVADFLFLDCFEYILKAFHAFSGRISEILHGGNFAPCAGQSLVGNPHIVCDMRSGRRQQRFVFGDVKQQFALSHF